MIKPQHTNHPGVGTLKPKKKKNKKQKPWGIYQKLSEILSFVADLKKWIKIDSVSIVSWIYTS